VLSNKYTNDNVYHIIKACYIYMNSRSVQKLAYIPWVKRCTLYF